MALFSPLDHYSQVHHCTVSLYLHILSRSGAVPLFANHNWFILFSPISSFLGSMTSLLPNVSRLKLPLPLHVFMYLLACCPRVGLCCCRLCAASRLALLRLPGWTSPWQFFALPTLSLLRHYWPSIHLFTSYYVNNLHHPLHFLRTAFTGIVVFLWDFTTPSACSQDACFP